MTTRYAQFLTPNASRYLQQMCKHFGHKVPVEFDTQLGRIELPFGTCRIEANDTALTMHIEGPDDAVSRLESVIGSHLERFAFREDPIIFWQSAVSTQLAKDTS